MTKLLGQLASGGVFLKSADIQGSVDAMLRTVKKVEVQGVSRVYRRRAELRSAIRRADDESCITYHGFQGRPWFIGMHQRLKDSDLRVQPFLRSAFPQDESGDGDQVPKDFMKSFCAISPERSQLPTILDTTLLEHGGFLSSLAKQRQSQT